MKSKVVIDGKNAILGRLASYAAKQVLLGKELAIVNCKEIVISGKTRNIINEYKEMRQKGGASLMGPFFPRNPERIVKRTIRGMLPYKKGRGANALKNVKCYSGMPEEFKESKKIVSGKEKNIKTIKLERLSKEI
ncbi:MAG: 50S ribosomal protein L13 [Candidatus Pacearchaeota archaeon]|nr:50S ribosomal protein L13 [Candidatus Pacearchaeota archaeon]